jgi:lantibiotic modifying enzyme
VTSSALRTIAARSATLTERLASKSLRFRPNTSRATERFLRWRACVTLSGDELLWNDRLHQERSPKRIKEVLGDAEWRNDAHLPRWTGLIDDALRAAAHSRPKPIEGSDEVPFSELCTPFIVVALDELQRRVGSQTFPISNDALRDMELGLLRALSTALGPTALHEFHIWRAVHISRLDAIISERTLGSRRLYASFVEDTVMHLEDFLVEYSRLARTLAYTIEMWVAATVRFLYALRQDRAAIENQLFLGRSPGRVVGVTPAMSDPHDGHRAVLRVLFEGDLLAYFKPRCLAVDTAFADLVRRFNHRGQIPTVRSVTLPSHGWSEAASRGSFTSIVDVKGYFRSAGGLLRLASLLGSIDCHHENIVATSHGPVLVDAECVLHGLPDWIPSSAPDDQARLVSTGLLPHWEHVGDESPFDVSGLGGTTSERVRPRTILWQNVGTDAITRQVVDPPSAICYPNAVVMADRPESVNDHWEEVLAGFDEMHRALWRSRAAISAPSGPLFALAEAPRRVVVRPTIVYSRLAERIAESSFQREGVDKSIELEVLSPTLQHAVIGSHPWQVAATERQAMENGDIPRFTWPPSRRIGRDDLKLVLIRIAELLPAPTASEVTFIQTSLARDARP